MIRAVPNDNPVTAPVAAFTVATAMLPLLHVPPEGVLVSVSVGVAPIHAISVLPVIDTGTVGVGLTVTTVVVKHGPTVYVIVAVFAGAAGDDIPVTTPVADIVATAGLLLLHTPPALALASAVVVPTHIVGVPVIADTAADAFTVAVAVTEHVTPVIVAVAVYTIDDVGAAYTVLVIVPAI